MFGQSLVFPVKVIVTMQWTVNLPVFAVQSPLGE